MDFFTNAVAWFLGLGSTVMVPIILIVLGLIFRVGWQKAVRGGVTTGVGLAGLFLIVDLIVAALQPATQGLADRLGVSLALVDVNWADCGIAWGWPGVAAVILGILVVNIVLVLLKLQKTIWTDVWSYWHGSALGGFIWALTGNVTYGVVGAVVYLTLGAWMSDLTAKRYQDFNEMPGIGVPCGTTVQASLFAIPVVWVLDRIPGLKDWDASPEGIRARFGLVGEPVIMGAILGMIIGIAAGYNVQGILLLGMQVATMMLILPRMVSIIAEGLIPITQSVVQFMRERFKDRELFVAVDCAVLLGHPAVMASAVILFPLSVLLAAVLPGVDMLPIASLAVIPFWAGAVVPYTKGNVIKTVIVLLLFSIPFMYFSTLTAGEHTAAYAKMGQFTEQIGAGTQLASWDMGGDPLGTLILAIYKLLGLSVL
ncbi:MAG: PTS galactitol transporter subunit IIC [Anaerolineales bacterium]|nr:MAG: PTS galactitol transporter subunit IIC [Anaerolineales bacterium]